MWTFKLLRSFAVMAIWIKERLRNLAASILQAKLGDCRNTFPYAPSLGGKGWINLQCQSKLFRKLGCTPEAKP